MTEPAAHIRAAFREVALGLMEWRDPAELTPRQYRRLEAVPEPRNVYRPHCAQDDAEPFDIQSDWEENN